MNKLEEFHVKNIAKKWEKIKCKLEIPPNFVNNLYESFVSHSLRHAIKRNPKVTRDSILDGKKDNIKDSYFYKIFLRKEREILGAFRNNGKLYEDVIKGEIELSCLMNYSSKSLATDHVNKKRDKMIRKEENKRTSPPPTLVPVQRMLSSSTSVWITKE